MRYCKRCVYQESSALKRTFDEKGVCSGCRVAEEKEKIDWNARKEQLRESLIHTGRIFKVGSNKRNSPIKEISEIMHAISSRSSYEFLEKNQEIGYKHKRRFEL